MDVHSKEQRSRNMAAIKGKNTKPELRLRSLLHRMGFRFRLHTSHLPGRPDIVLPKHRTAIFLHGCFWHKHDCRYGRVTPRTNAAFWEAKREGTVKRDAEKASRLSELGWKVRTVWECELRTPDQVAKQAKRWMKI